MCMIITVALTEKLFVINIRKANSFSFCVIISFSKKSFLKLVHLTYPVIKSDSFFYIFIYNIF